MNARALLDERLHALGAAAFAHMNGTLEQHLHGTERLLRQWGNRDGVCVAGLFHTIYGTDGIDGCLTSIDARDEVAGMIGREAEALVYLYGSCDRERFHPRIGTGIQNRFVDRFAGREYVIGDAMLRDFCEITVANELDLALGNPAFARRHAGDLLALFGRMHGLISHAAECAAGDVLSRGGDVSRTG